jgi:hypothetical protein
MSAIRADVFIIDIPCNNRLESVLPLRSLNELIEINKTSQRAQLHQHRSSVCRMVIEMRQCSGIQSKPCCIASRPSGIVRMEAGIKIGVGSFVRNPMTAFQSQGFVSCFADPIARRKQERQKRTEPTQSQSENKAELRITKPSPLRKHSMRTVLANIRQDHRLVNHIGECQGSSHGILEGQP